MSKAIKIQTEKAPEKYDLGASKFFGTPTLPIAWEKKFDEDEIFFCQVRLADIAALDEENRLPHTGYLYVFLHTEGGLSHLCSDVRYYDGTPDLAYEDFNLAVDGYEQYNDAYLMRFCAIDACEDCTRLFGVPSDWSYGEAPPPLLLQYDPLEHDFGFLDFMDGFLYFFFEKGEKDLNAVTLRMEYS